MRITVEANNEDLQIPGSPFSASYCKIYFSVTTRGPEITANTEAGAIQLIRTFSMPRNAPESTNEKHLRLLREKNQRLKKELAESEVKSRSSEVQAADSHRAS
jgi:hypothetical protein